MAQKIRKSLSVIIISALLLGFLPTASLAADNEDVIKSIGQEYAEATVNPGNNHDIQFVIDYSQHEKITRIGLTSLDREYNSGYTDVYCTVESNTAEINGAAVGMTVTYRLTSEVGANPDTAPTYTTTYRITAVWGEPEPPSFSGTVTKTVRLVSGGTATVTFTSSDFTSHYQAGDSDAISAISIPTINSGLGKLYMGSSEYNMGDLIPINSLSDLTFVADGKGSASYRAYAYAGDDTSTQIGSVDIVITISGITAPTISSAVTKSVNTGSTITFSLSDFSSHYNLNGGTLSSIIVKPESTSYGIWYNGSSAFTTATTFTASTIGNLKFKGSSAGTQAFNWTVSNEAGASQSGSGTVTVSLSISTITYTTDQNETFLFRGTNFNSVCKNADLAELQYITISSLPSSSKGTLYYNYSTSSKSGIKVATGTKLYYNTSNSTDLNKVAFVPASDYSGSFTLNYTGTDNNGVQYTGTITINVRKSSVSAVSFTAGKNTDILFDGDAFNNVCKDADYDELNYITISALPSSSRGTLYYNYSTSSGSGTKLTTGTKLYYDTNNSTDLDKVAFVPASSYTSNFTLSYIGLDNDGKSFTGTIKLTIGTDVNTITYQTGKNAALLFDGNDFNEACEDAGYDELNYIRITTDQSTSKGTLYYNSSSSSTGTKVATGTSGTKLYYDTNNSTDLDKVTFVPASSYTGTLTLSYVGLDNDGESFTGTIKIIVFGTVDAVSYTTKVNTPVPFDADDFNDVCVDLTGKPLSYVTFTLPTASNGKLYYNYNTSTDTGTSVSSSTQYHRSSASFLSQVTFVPATGKYGTAIIDYTAYNTAGIQYSGTIVLTITQNSGASNYFSDVGSSYSWATDPIDYLYKNGIVTGTASNRFSPGAEIKRGDFILMLYRALDLSATIQGNFSDVPRNSYYYNAIGVAKALNIAQGDGTNFNPEDTLARQDAIVFVCRALKEAGITISAGSSSDISRFTDKNKISGYALSSVESLVKIGVIQGSGNQLNPGSSLTRAEMSVILYKVLKL